MGRLHSNGKGISKSAIPYSRTPPPWLKISPDQIVEQICRLAKKGATPSQIGVVLRDSHGIAQVKVITGNKILRILKSNGLAPEVPEDLYMLIRKVSRERQASEGRLKTKQGDVKVPMLMCFFLMHFRPYPYANTSNVTAKTKTLNSDLF